MSQITRQCHRCCKTFCVVKSATEAFCPACLAAVRRGEYFEPASSERPPACPRMGICLDVEPTRVYLENPKYRGRRRGRTPKRHR